jgi:hypothetical protein
MPSQWIRASMIAFGRRAQIELPVVEEQRRIVGAVARHPSSPASRRRPSPRGRDRSGRRSGQRRGTRLA